MMISVVIPTYNAEATIERTLGSVLAQTYRDLEVIVSDDGSSDGTVEIVNFIAKRDARVRLLSNTHAGPSAARNAGIEVAEGEWITFLDADDEYTPKAFEAIIKRIDTQEVGLVIFSTQIIQSHIYDWPPKITRLKNQYFAGNGQRADSFMREYLAKKQMLVYSPSNKLYRRSVLEAHRIRFPENLRFGEDRLFNFEYLKHAGSVLTMKELLHKHYYGRQGSLSSEISNQQFHDLFSLSKAKIDLFRYYGFSEQELQSLKQHDMSQILNESVKALIRRDRSGGKPLVRKGVCELLSMRFDPLFLSFESAVSRRTRLMQYAIKTRNAGLITTLVQLLRRTEDRRIMKRRELEIDKEQELERLGLNTAGRREKARYFYLADYEYFLDIINKERFRHLVGDKGILLQRLSENPKHKFLGREWLDLRRSTFSDFERFIHNNDRIVVKLYNGRWSHGTEVIDCVLEREDVTGFYERLIQKKQYIVENYLTQHPDVARVYPKALTSFRVHTLCLGSEVKIVLPPVAKFGSAGANTSNSRDIQVIFDLETGRFLTDGMYRAAANKGRRNEVFKCHPDTDVSFSDAKVPFVEETKQLVTEAARLVPELPFMGWDVAYTSEGPVILESNAASLVIYSWQVMLREFMGQKGMRSDFYKMCKNFKNFDKKQRAKSPVSEHSGGVA